MRNFCAVALAAALFATNAFAADAPLAPGKPAGLKQAQEADLTFIYIVGAGIAAAGIAIVASGDSDKSGVTPGTGTQ